MVGLTGKRATMDESGSTKREEGSHELLEDGGLREIVERATHPEKEPPEPREKRRLRPPSRVLRTLIGLALYVGSLAGFSIGIVHMMHIGSCGGSSQYVIRRECPSGTGWYIGLMIASIFVALYGSVLAGLGMAIPMGLGFTVLGAAALYGGLTAPDSADTAATGYAMGSIFIVMGLVSLGFGIWFRRSLASDADSVEEPTLSPLGLAQLINATAPKPLPGDVPGKKSSNDQEQKGEGG